MCAVFSSSKNENISERFVQFINEQGRRDGRHEYVIHATEQDTFQFKRIVQTGDGQVKTSYFIQFQDQNIPVQNVDAIYIRKTNPDTNETFEELVIVKEDSSSAIGTDVFTDLRLNQIVDFSKNYHESVASLPSGKKY